MAIYNSTTEWYSLPITTVVVYYGSGASDNVLFSNIDVNSSFEIVPIYAPNQTDSGVKRVVAYRITSNVIVAENDVVDMADDIAMMASEQPTGLYITFGGTTNKANSKAITFTIGTLASSTLSFDSDSGGFGTDIKLDLRNTADLQFTFNIEILLSPDALSDATNHPFANAV